MIKVSMFDAVDFAGLDNPEIALEHGLIDHEHYKLLKDMEHLNFKVGERYKVIKFDKSYTKEKKNKPIQKMERHQ